jgi:hypothetical protein
MTLPQYEIAYVFKRIAAQAGNIEYHTHHEVEECIFLGVSIRQFYVKDLVYYGEYEDD